MTFKKFEIEFNQDLAWRLLLLFSLIFVILNASDAAFASTTSSTTPSTSTSTSNTTTTLNTTADPTNDVIGATLCRLVANLGGGIARGIATMAIFSVGVGLFLGKLNWGVAAATAAGVGVIFSAPRLVAFLSGVSGTENCMG